MTATERGWQREFEDTILLPDGRKLATLRDAALYINKLPKSEHDAEEWQAAMNALLLVAGHGGGQLADHLAILPSQVKHAIGASDPGVARRTP